MKTKKLLAILVVAAMMFATVAAIAACHTHDYTEWGTSTTEHWKYCPDDDEIDESTRATHSYTWQINGSQHYKACECGAVEAGTTGTHSYVDGECECGAIDPHQHSYTAWGTSATEHWKKCPDDDAEEAGTRATHNYVEGECECGAKDPHTHDYTAWGTSDTEHWKKCPDDDAEEADTRATHSYTDGACECGVHSYTGTGTSADPYIILNAAGLQTVATNVNAGTWTGKYIELGADIDLAGIEWTPIGNVTTKFTGSFDGKYHTISNMTITTFSDYTGLFGYVGSNATIANLKIVGASINISGTLTSTSLGAGILAGRVGLTKDQPTNVTNISIDSTSTITVAHTTSTANYGVGGFVGQLWYSNIIACHFSGTIGGTSAAANTQCIGGIAGWVNGGEDKGTGVYACIMDGSIDITSNTTSKQLSVGGIVGYGKQADSNTYISGNFFNGTIAVESSVDQYVAGIIGQENDCYARFNISTGTISAPNCSVGTICAVSWEHTPSSNMAVEGYTPVGNVVDDGDPNGNPVTHELSWFYTSDHVSSLFGQFPTNKYTVCNITNPATYFAYSDTALPTLAWETAAD